MIWIWKYLRIFSLFYWIGHTWKIFGFGPPGGLDITKNILKQNLDDYSHSSARNLLLIFLNQVSNFYFQQIGNFRRGIIIHEKTQISAYKWLFKSRPQVSSQNLISVRIVNLAKSLISLSRPLHRKHIQHATKARKEILLHGYKYFSKVSAVGESTVKTLKSISKCAASRMIYSFQFDP